MIPSPNCASRRLVIYQHLRPIVFACVSVIGAGIATGDEPIDFNRDIRPLFSNSCWTCHGPDEGQRATALRLDTESGSQADLGGYAAVVPGQPDSSELLLRLTTDDPEMRMPPAGKGRRLSPQEVDRVRRWIEQGGHYARHWAYEPPQRPALPEVSRGHWIRNPIDQFVLARLESQQLAPALEADRLTLARRVALDLTGLPPSWEEAKAFADDPASNAYESYVDRQLAKPAFGERWARVWLDLARYADSAGYADDPPRTIWAYRDYVIRALNQNKPFHQFTIEQIAGDLLPDPTAEQLIATAFHRNTLTNNEGGTNDEEFRNVAVVDRVNTTMAVWMGTTMACAQCHSHKYDPISQQEYFQFFDFFNQTQDADLRDEQPTLAVYSDSQQSERRFLEAQIQQLTQQLESATPALQAAQAEWVRRLRERPQTSLPVEARYVRIVLPGSRRHLHVAEIEIFVGDENIARQATASQSSTAYDAPASRAIDGNTNGDFYQGSVTHTDGESDPWLELELPGSAPISRIVVWNRTDGGQPIRERLNGLQLQLLDPQRNVVWQQTSASFSEDAQTYRPGIDTASQLPTVTDDGGVVRWASLPESVAALIAVPAAEQTPQQHAELAAYYRSIAPELSETRRALADAKQRLSKIQPVTTVPVMRQVAAAAHRQTHIHLRGNYQSAGEQVTAGTPAVFHPLDSELPRDRLALAHWLIDDDNPLTARVTANRHWEEIFGTGIVPTSEEFGSQGEPPTHPQLLDWLAVELRDSGWDLKHLLKLMVTSATYRQSSVAGASQREMDPDNRWYSRGPRVRVSAEMVRDQALWVSGLLSDKMFGPPVRPPQPELGLKAAFGSATDWTTSDGEDRYRRAIYTLWRRSNPYPSMAQFDAPNREVCTVRRIRTNTPLQALVTLNDPVYVETAQALARRMIAAAAEPERRIEFAIRNGLIREPKQAELERLQSLAADALEAFRTQPEQALQLATDPLGPLPAGAEASEYAAWTVVANVILNLDEFFLKP